MGGLACPSCGSTKLMAVPDSEAMLCYACRHEFVPARSVVPLRIFLSYGHDANEELVRRIRRDLDARGHDVWFDKSEIKAGDDWRRSITEGIVGSDRFLSFLSKHSTRDPGVCRDEIGIALGVKSGNVQTILVESERDVQPPASISHIQWLDMHDWKARRAEGEAAWESWYAAKLAEIVRVVESDESRRFAGEIETLSRLLKPIPLDARVSQLLSKGFVGRDRLFEELERWRRDSASPSRLFWLVGPPGIGKSAFAARLVHARGDAVIAAHFCEWDKLDHRDPRAIVRSLAFQMATRLPDYRQLLLTLPEIERTQAKDEGELFDYLLANPLRHAIGGSRDRSLIVIDALDEAGLGGRNPLVEMLAQNADRLPDWLGLVATSRPEYDVKAPFAAFSPHVMDAGSEANRSDLRTYVASMLRPELASRSDREGLVEEIVGRSEGVFLYVERFCEEVRKGRLSLHAPDQFPQGLAGIYYRFFQRLFPDIGVYRQQVRPALRLVFAAREPLPTTLLKRLMNWSEEELRDFLRPLASFLEPVGRAEGDEVRPRHKSYGEWIGDERRAGDFYASAVEGHRLLADACWEEYQSLRPDVSSISDFTIFHLAYHLEAAGRSDDVDRLQANRAFVEERERRWVARDLEAFAQLEHERWIKSRARSGWIYGPALNRERKTNPHLVPWSQLRDDRRSGTDRPSEGS